MRTNYARWVDPVIIQMLQLIAPPFPPGSRLSLSDGTSAVVIQSNAHDPFKPLVSRITGEDLKMVGDPIDLATEGCTEHRHDRQDTSATLPAGCGVRPSVNT